MVKVCALVRDQVVVFDLSLNHYADQSGKGSGKHVFSSNRLGDPRLLLYMASMLTRSAT